MRCSSSLAVGLWAKRRHARPPRRRRAQPPAPSSMSRSAPGSSATWSGPPRPTSSSSTWPGGTAIRWRDTSPARPAIMPPVLFPLEHNWREPYELELALSTDVLDARDGSEQRVQLRTIPRRTERLSLTAGHRAQGLLDGLLFAGQSEQWVLPYWPHVTALTAPVAAGSTVSLPCVTTDRDFAVGGLAVLWRDPFTAEVVTLTGLTSGNLTAQTVAGTWPVGTLVLPGRLGRWADDFRL